MTPTNEQMALALAALADGAELIRELGGYYAAGKTKTRKHKDGFSALVAYSTERGLQPIYCPPPQQDTRPFKSYASLFEDTAPPQQDMVMVPLSTKTATSALKSLDSLLRRDGSAALCDLRDALAGALREEDPNDV